MEVSAARKSDWLSVAQLAVSSMGVLSLLLAAFGLLTFAVVKGITETSLPENMHSIMATSLACLLFAGLLIPSVVYSLRRLLDKPSSGMMVMNIRVASLAMIAFPLAVAVGSYLSTQSLAWLFLPPVQLAAVALPLWGIVAFASHRLPAGSKQRQWGLLAFSLLISPVFILMVELVMITLAIALVAVWVGQQPDLTMRFQVLFQALSTAEPDLERVMTLVKPLLNEPILAFTGLALVCVLVPLVEEALKSMALWMVAKRPLTPAQGFIGGMICGAGFALLESLGNLAAPVGENWLVLILGRFGTGILHIGTTGLMGWALAQAWQKSGSWVKLGGVYLAAVVIHGVWNFFGLLMGFGPLLGGTPLTLPGMLQPMANIAPIVLIGLAALLLAVMTWTNFHLRSAAHADDIKLQLD